MSDKLQIKGNIVVSDPDIEDWFDFENKVLKAIRNNQKHTLDAVCEVKSYYDTEIIESHKIIGKPIDWQTFAPMALKIQNENPTGVVSCTVTLKAGKKGKSAEKAFDDNQLDMFATTKVETTLEAFENHKDMFHEMFQAGKNSEDEESDEELESEFIDKLKENVDLETGEVC